MKFEVYINCDWSPYTNTYDFRSIGEFDTQELAEQAIAAALNQRYPDSWIKDGDQYVRKQSGAGNLKLVRIEIIRTEVEQLQQDIDSIIENIDRLHSDLREKSKRLSEVMGLKQPVNDLYRTHYPPGYFGAGFAGGVAPKDGG
jgi:putative lipoic acid-binding regulatory protein